MTRVTILTDIVTETPKELTRECNVKLSAVNIAIDGKSYPEDELDRKMSIATGLESIQFCRWSE
jgi:hypothetical protein